MADALSHDTARTPRNDLGKTGTVGIGSVLDGIYRIEAKLGSGGSGEVYRAVHVDLGRAFAVKVLNDDADPDAAWRLVQEAKTVSSFDHRHIVEVVHLARDTDGPLYVVMELLEGEDLRERLARREHDDRGISLAEARDLLLQTLSGLSAAHRAGVVHRDIKPANIFITEEDDRTTVKLVDFGMSRCTGDEVRLTRTGELIGTPLYMSPEQSNGVDVGPPADVYSFGVVAYEVLSGRVPFPATSLYECVLSHATKPVPPLDPAAIPAPLIEFVERCLSKDPGDRFEDAIAARAALQAAFDAAEDPEGAKTYLPGAANEATRDVRASTSGVFPSPTPEPREDPVTPPRPGPSRARMAMATLVVVGLLVAAFLAARSAPSRSQAAADGEHAPSPGQTAAPMDLPAVAEPEPRPSPSAEAAPSSVTATPPEGADIRRITSVPAEAIVTRTSDGAVLGTTPLDVVVSETPVELQVRYPGYTASTVEVSHRSPADLAVTLTRARGEPSRRRPRPGRRPLPELAPR